MEPFSQEFLNRAFGCTNLYEIDPSDAETIALLRQIRRELGDRCLQTPRDRLEDFYYSEAGKSYQHLLRSGFHKEPLTDEERAFLRQVTERGRDISAPEALGCMMAAMLYKPPGKLYVREAGTFLPPWLLAAYQRVFESEGALKQLEDTLGETVVASPAIALEQVPVDPGLESDRRFINRTIGCANLYEIDPSQSEIVAETQEVRRTLAGFWLSVASDRLEALLQAEIGKAYLALLHSGFQKEPLDALEGQFLQRVSHRAQGLANLAAVQNFMVAMLYIPKEKVRVPNAETRLPQWLFPVYQALVAEENVEEGGAIAEGTPA